MEENGIFLPISEIGVKYFHPVEYDENLAILLEITEITRVKVSFNYEFWNETLTVKYADRNNKESAAEIVTLRSDTIHT